MIYHWGCGWKPIDQACSRGPRKAERDRGWEWGYKGGDGQKNPPMMKCSAMHRKSNSNIRAHSWHSAVPLCTFFSFPLPHLYAALSPVSSFVSLPGSSVIYSIWIPPPSSHVKAFLSHSISSEKAILARGSFSQSAWKAFGGFRPENGLQPRYRWWTQNLNGTLTVQEKRKIQPPLSRWP